MNKVIKESLKHPASLPYRNTRLLHFAILNVQRIYGYGIPLWYCFALIILPSKGSMEANGYSLLTFFLLLLLKHFLMLIKYIRQRM